MVLWAVAEEQSMSRHYASFLIRCWRLSEEVERIKIEHIQSGESAQVTTVEAAFAWMEAHWPARTRDLSHEQREQHRDIEAAKEEAATDSVIKPQEKG
jgi:hypothetical protein